MGRIAGRRVIPRPAPALPAHALGRGGRQLAALPQAGGGELVEQLRAVGGAFGERRDELARRRRVAAQPAGAAARQRGADVGHHRVKRQGHTNSDKGGRALSTSSRSRISSTYSHGGGHRGAQRHAHVTERTQRTNDFSQGTFVCSAVLKFSIKIPIWIRALSKTGKNITARTSLNAMPVGVSFQ